jgi:hypothetical protein
MIEFSRATVAASHADEHYEFTGNVICKGEVRGRSRLAASLGFDLPHGKG